MCKRVGTPEAWMTLAVAAWLTFLGGTASAAQQQERELFRRTDRVRADAIEARADILAPRSFGQAMRRYQEAERDLERERSREDVEKKLREARQYFEQAIEIAQLGYPVLAPALEARDDAERAEAPDLAARLWQDGVDKLDQAAHKIRAGGDQGDPPAGNVGSTAAGPGGETSRACTSQLRSRRGLGGASGEPAGRGPLRYR